MTGGMRVALSRRADYAVRAMLALAAVESGAASVSVRWISARMGIPVRFLPHVMTDLARAGLVISTAGRRGGYRLARAAAGISILDVVDAVESDEVGPICVLRGGPCQPDGRCAVHDAISSATAAMRASLAARDLADIARAGGLQEMLGG